MKITKQGSDFIILNEGNLNDESLINIYRVHLIKLDFLNPNNEKIDTILKLYPRTNRFVVGDNIKIYNNALRSTLKKYYIENSKGVDLITFFRKNNKILLNFLNLSEEERKFLLIDNIFRDVLRNTEVIYVNNNIFTEKKKILDLWSGNVIISEE